MLDSNIIIALTTNRSANVIRRAADCDEGDMVASAVAYAEVAFGSHRGNPPATAQLRAFVEEVPILAFDHRAALAYASLPFRRASYDRLIAAHALSLGLIVVTDNERHFSDVPGLRVENWMGPDAG